MKNLIIVLFSILLLNACKKDKNQPLYDYQMTKYDEQVTPAERQVSILFQVIDKDGVGVDQLTETSFNVYENSELIGSEAGVEIDASLIPTTIRTAILLDRSSSVNPLISQLKEASIALINLGFDNQEFAVFTFDGYNTTSMIQGFTSNKQTLIATINAIPDESDISSTDLYGAIIDVTDNSMFTWTEYYGIVEISVTNLIVFTDGNHTADPSVTLDMVITSIGDKKVYVAALGSDLDEGALKQIATEGGYVSASNKDELKAKFEEVQGKIIKLSNSLYYLYYTSPITNPASYENDLEIKIKDNTDRLGNSIKTTFNSEGFSK